MTPTSFVYWLQGFLELTEQSAITPKQVEIIKQHLALVLKHESGVVTVPTMTLTAPTPPGNLSQGLGIRGVGDLTLTC